MLDLTGKMVRFGAGGIAMIPLLLACPVEATLTKSWESVIPGAGGTAFVVVDSSGAPRTVFRTASGAVQFVSFDNAGSVLVAGSYPAASDGMSRTANGAVAVPGGGAISCGSVTGFAAPMSLPPLDGLAVRFAGSGAVEWSKTVNDVDLGACGYHSMASCAVSGRSIYVVGSAMPPPPFPAPSLSCPFIPSNFKSFLIRLDSLSGAITGSRIFIPSAGDGFYSAIASSGGAVFALGSRGSSMVLDRYDGDLNLVWTATATATGLTPVAVAVSSRGEISVLGQRGTLDARVYRFGQDGSLFGESIVPFPETSGVALTDGATSFVSGRQTAGASLASASPASVVAIEYQDPAAVRYLSAAVDGQNGVYVTVERAGDFRIAKFSPGASTSTGLLSIRPGADGQVGVINADLPTRLEVYVRDPSSAPIAGASLAFAVSSEPVTGSGAAVNPPTGVSGADGLGGTSFHLGRLPFEYKISCACSSCGGVAGSSVTFSACGKLPSEHFLQSDSRWGNDAYDDTQSSMAAEGCATSSLAALSEYYRISSSSSIPGTNPGDLNRSLRGMGENGYQAQGRVNWQAINTISGNQIRLSELRDIDSTTTAQDLIASIDADLALGRPVITRVRRRRANGSHSTHFVLVVGQCQGGYLIADPGSAVRDRFNPADADFTLTGIRRFRPVR